MQQQSIKFTGYTIGNNIISDLTKNYNFLGQKIIVIGGKTALEKTKDYLEKAFINFKILSFEIYGTDCTYKEIERLEKIIKDKNPDFIIGVGGGKALDTAKACAYKTNLPIYTIPTIAATCAAITALSVIYKEDGSFDEFLFFDYPPEHCFIDLNIIVNAPVCYLKAGLGDAIGKYFEAHFSSRNDKLLHNSDLGIQISNMCYYPFLQYGLQAIKDCENNLVTKYVEQVVLNNIVSTGMVSVLVDDCYNCAIAHSVYYGLALLPNFEEQNLHGVVVSYGVLVQLLVDKQIDEAKKLKHFLQQLNMPVCLKDMNVLLENMDFDLVLNEILASPDMEHIPYKVTKDMLYNAIIELENLS